MVKDIHEERYMVISKLKLKNLKKEILIIWSRDRPRPQLFENCNQQEPITRSEQLSCTRVTAFSRTSLFLELFWRELRLSFKSDKEVNQTYRPKNDNFCFK